MKRALLDDLRRARSERHSVVLMTWLDSGDQCLWRAGDDGCGPLSPGLADAACIALRDDRPFPPRRSP